MLKIKHYARNYRPRSEESPLGTAAKTSSETTEQFFARLEKETISMLDDGWVLAFAFQADKFIVHYYVK